MGSQSRHWADLSIWIQKIIDSCVTIEQLNTATKLVVNYDKYLSGEKKKDLIHVVAVSQLQRRILDKRYELKK
jgi:hypothetical protein